VVSRSTDLREGEGSYAALDDRMLVLDFQSGNPEAYLEVHRRYSGLARHVCKRFLPNQQDADEAFQETMIRVFQGLHRFNGQFALQPWVARIATNVSLDAIRASSRRPVQDGSVEDFDRADSADGPERLYEKLVERDLVLSVLADLPESHRRALVLRELEGASHKEIAEDLGMTPSQAKALIHRAKGSFRRGWMEKVAQRNGLAGIALLPLVGAFRVVDAFRRVAERLMHVAAQTAQTAQVATSELMTSTTSAAPSAISMADRVIAAGMTLLVAGGVTVGAASIAKHRSDRGHVEAVAAPPTVAASPTPAVAPPVKQEPHQNQPSRSDRLDNGPKAVPPVRGGDPSPLPPPTPTPVPTPTPTPDPTTTPPPVPPPAPDWSGSFVVAWTSEDSCSCGPGLSLVSSQTNGGLLGESGSLDVQQALQGAALDAEGDAAWALSADLEAKLSAADGSLDVSFSLEKDGVKTSYEGSGHVTSISGDIAAGDPVMYSFSGTYAAVGVSDKSPIPTSGSLTATMIVWSDGSTSTLTGLSLLQ
jgi:RNA polymerase sigma-70 factor (ECF subfamily)